MRTYRTLLQIKAITEDTVTVRVPCWSLDVAHDQKLAVIPRSLFDGQTPPLEAEQRWLGYAAIGAETPEKFFVEPIEGLALEPDPDDGLS
jgi:hypothetical protein